MDIFSALAFIPGDEPKKTGPLARFLPPVPEGVTRVFLAEHSEPKAWVLDPFGASPQLMVEMARLGHRVVVAVNNPVTRFLLEMTAEPPSRMETKAALAELAAARKGEQRLETHLQSLYLTECSKCQRTVPAEAFVWERGGETPVARLYHCPCGESGEYEATSADKARARQMAATATLHRSRALERVIAHDDPDRVHVEEALECYLPRAVYALITIVNKLDSLTLHPNRRRALMALVLSTCDEASTLWPHPAERPRPKQLTVPPRFLEKNIWLALEGAVETWADDAPPVPLTIWPNPPPESGGICLFEGPLRDLAPRLKEINVQAVVTSLPRPNQAFWTLSALWAGWLWGREAVRPFKSALHRRRYDWNWHAAALYAALKNLSAHIPLNAPLFALLAEAEPSFLSAALLAAAGAGFDLHGLALRTRHDPIQLLWHRRAFVHEEKADVDAKAIRQAMQDYLAERGEPVAYLHLHAAGLASMVENHTLYWGAEALTQLHAPIQAALAAPGFLHHGESENPETGLWGLKAWNDEKESLPERVEMAVVRFLQTNSGCTLRELEGSLNTEFPGLFTPSLGLVRDILASYAILTDEKWFLRPEDSPSARRADLESAAQTLTTLAPRLGFGLEQQERPRRMLLWQENGQVTYAFYLLACAVIREILHKNPYPPERSLLVLPGGRAGLLACKLRRDPNLQSIWEDGWGVLKFRQLRRLSEMTGLTRQRFEKELSDDPLEPPEQMRMF